MIQTCTIIQNIEKHKLIRGSFFIYSKKITKLGKKYGAKNTKLLMDQPTRNSWTADNLGRGGIF